MTDRRADRRTNNRADRSRRRRRPRRQPPFDASVPSPCRAVCRFDGEPYCQGCRRTADEIRDWPIMTRERKLAVLALIEDRRRQAETG